MILYINLHLIGILMDNKYKFSFTMGANIVTWTKNFVIVFLMVTYVNSSKNV